MHGSVHVSSADARLALQELVALPHCMCASSAGTIHLTEEAINRSSRLNHTPFHCLLMQVELAIIVCCHLHLCEMRCQKLCDDAEGVAVQQPDDLTGVRLGAKV